MVEINKADELCPYCGEQLYFTDTQQTLIHYGRLDCKKCNKWIRWISNPSSNRKGNSTSNKNYERVLKIHSIDKEICFFCLREQNQLGEKETLTLDHIQELSHGGKDDIYNMQILCTSCHKLKNWARLYMNWHHNKEVKQ
jgi:5-methylcytosine-specific restriction protein A